MFKNRQFPVRSSWFLLRFSLLGDCELNTVLLQIQAVVFIFFSTMTVAPGNVVWMSLLQLRVKEGGVEQERNGLWFEFFSKFHILQHFL